MVAGPAGGLVFSTNIVLGLIIAALAALIVFIGVCFVKHWAVFLTAAIFAFVAVAEFSGMVPTL
jgi:hypothetical protein